MGSRATRPIVSVVIPVYNREALLRPALASVLAQDYSSFEVVVVDDGSSDGSALVAETFFGVKTIRQSNRGPSAARNTGIAATTGEYVCFVDADDRIPPNKLSLQADYLTQHPDVGCVLGRQEVRFVGVEQPDWFKRDPVYHDLTGINFITAMVRRSVLEEVGGFNEEFRTGEDRDLMIRLRSRGVRMEILPNVVLFRTFHGDNLTLQAPAGGATLLNSLRDKLAQERADADAKGGP